MSKKSIGIILGFLSPIMEVVCICVTAQPIKTILILLFVGCFLGTFIFGGAATLKAYFNKCVGIARKVCKWATTFHFSFVYVWWFCFKIFFGLTTALFIVIMGPMIPLVICPWALVIGKKTREMEG